MGAKFIKNFKFAFEGLREVFNTQRSFRIQIVLGIIAIVLGIFFRVSSIEWVFIILSIGLVLSFEMVNTAIEAAIDLTTMEIHPKAKLAKDLSAGAVLVNASVAFLIGVFIFVPHIIRLF